jgi:hypothetical protein
VNIFQFYIVKLFLFATLLSLVINYYLRYMNEQKNSTFLLLPWMDGWTTKGLAASPPEIDRNQTAMGLPPVTSAVFLIAKSFW